MFLIFSLPESIMMTCNVLALTFESVDEILCRDQVKSSQVRFIVYIHLAFVRTISQKKKPLQQYVSHVTIWFQYFTKLNWNFS